MARESMPFVPFRTQQVSSLFKILLTLRKLATMKKKPFLFGLSGADRRCSKSTSVIFSLTLIHNPNLTLSDLLFKFALRYATREESPSATTPIFLLSHYCTMYNIFQLTASNYLDVVEAFQPDWFQGLCDTVCEPSVSLKRVCKSVDRTLRYLDEALSESEKRKALGQCFLLGNIQGAGILSERLRSVKETVKRPVKGFVLEGFDFSVDSEFAETLMDVLRQSVACLPEDKPRILPGPMPVGRIVEAVESGIDIFDSSYVYELTTKGQALNLYWREDVEDWDKEQILDLTNEKYRDNMSPLEEGYSLAYIHHLLNVKEMLGDVILMRHNLKQYLRFFQELRHSIKNNKFDKFKTNLAANFN
eukprot:m.107191 g.107191  ORF g.107191 m.107191 type:complete len:361 (+) comp37287_c0_seq12:251-1333(+)